MSSFYCVITSYFISASWQVAAIGAAGWIVSRLCKRLGPPAQHRIWVASLWLAILTPAVALWHLPVEFRDVQGHLQQQASVLLARGGRLYTAETNAGLVLPPSVILVLSVLYASALAYFAVRLTWLLRCTLALIREAEPVLLNPQANKAWGDSKRAFLVEDASLLQSQKVSSPVTVQFTRPVLLLPLGFADTCSPADFLAALGHECAHMRRRDFLKNVLYEFATLPIAFHPVTWMLKSQIAQTREMICDAMATEHLIDARTYRRSLLRLASYLPSAACLDDFSAIGIFDNGPDTLEKRIFMIKAKRPQVSMKLRYGLTIIGAGLLLLVGGGSAAITKPVQASSGQNSQAPAARKAQRKDLACTYWQEPENKPYAGTCGTKAGDAKTYYCFRNDDLNVSQIQSSCEGKLKRALADSK